MAKRLPNGFAHWIAVVKEDVSRYEREVLLTEPVASSTAVHRLLAPRILSESVERMYIVGVDGQNHVMFLHEVARGGRHGCAMSTADILRPVLMGGASGFILVHNHPSGDPTPSLEDITLTRKICEASAIVQVPLLDHIVIASMDRYHSMLDMGLAGL